MTRNSLALTGLIALTLMPACGDSADTSANGAHGSVSGSAGSDARMTIGGAAGVSAKGGTAAIATSGGVASASITGVAGVVANGGASFAGMASTAGMSNLGFVFVTQIGDGCLPRKLIVDEETKLLSCAVVEVMPPDVDPTWRDCEVNARSFPSTELANFIRTTIQRDGLCGSTSATAPCTEFSLCQLGELMPGLPSYDLCETATVLEPESVMPGYCYIDPVQGLGTPEVVAACPGIDEQKWMMRIVGNSNSIGRHLSAPAPGAQYLACKSAALSN